MDDYDEHLPKPSIFNYIKTFLTFIIALCFSPMIVLCYISVQISRKVWLNILSSKFPHLDFVENISIRTILDNHRNQGVINILLTIKGNCRATLIHQTYIKYIINKRDRFDNYQFPKLRAALVSCWGNYAWKRDIQFNLENHLLVGKPVHRGRPITDHNIQEYVNDIITRYLPSGPPPWQIIVIPNVNSIEQKYFVLIRVHHLLIADDEPLSIGDFLLLKSDSETHDPEASTNQESNDTTKSPLSGILEKPKSSPKLYSMLCDSLSNTWNEFINEYDPIESQKLSKIPPDLFHCLAIITIAFASICKEFNKTLSLCKNDLTKFLKLYASMFYREVSKRNLTPRVFLKSIWITLNPLTSLVSFIKCFWWLSKVFTVKFSQFLYNEIMAYTSFDKYYNYHNSYVAFFKYYSPLLSSVYSEMLMFFKLIYTAPINIIRELFLSDDEEHELKCTSLCGRKVVAWSHPISAKHLREMATKVQVTETEILLNMTNNCLKEYFRHASFDFPDTLLITAKTTACDTMIASMEEHSPSINERIDGITCLSLPIGLNLNTKEEFIYMKKVISKVRNTQGALYGLGANHEIIVQVLPSVLARIILNYLSRKFSVTITEIAESSNSNHRTTEWGHTVHSILCWRPPQGNIRMSLVLQRYADTVRIGVIADAQLSPHHTAIARYWTKSAKRIATDFGIPHH